MYLFAHKTAEAQGRGYKNTAQREEEESLSSQPDHCVY